MTHFFAMAVRLRFSLSSNFKKISSSVRSWSSALLLSMCEVGRLPDSLSNASAVYQSQLIGRRIGL